MREATCAFKDCGSKVIKINEANIVNFPDSIIDAFRLMRDRSNESKEQVEFLIVNDVWDFENVGVSKDIPPPNITLMKDNETDLEEEVSYEFNHDNKTWKILKCLKYLICADCDKGPIGMVCEAAEKENDSAKKAINFLNLGSVNA